MLVSNFSEIEAEFIKRVHSMVWCSVATIDSLQRPRSRILHPIWEGATGWIGTHRNSHKAEHLAHNPHVSLAYIRDIMNPVYVDCTTEWVDDLAQKQHIWELFKTAPAPLGYDPTDTFISPNHPNFGLLKLTPWRIDLVNFPTEDFAACQIWRRSEPFDGERVTIATDKVSA